MLYATLSQNSLYLMMLRLTYHGRRCYSLILPSKSGDVDLEYSENSIPPESSSVGKENFPVALATDIHPQFFIDALPEAQLLVEEIIHCLDERHKKYLPPVDFSSGQYGEVLEQLQDKLLRCDRVILILGKNTPISWLRNHLKFYKKVQIQRKTPLHVTVYDRSKRHLPDLDFPNLSTCYTSQDCVE